MAKERDISKCDVCGKEESCLISFKLDTAIGKASWWFDFIPRGSMCKQCSEELLECIHKWYNNQNTTDALKKFKLK